MKTQIKCPFEIRFSYINYIARHKKPPVFYRVRITKVNSNHTCSLCSEFLNQANRVSRGKTKYNLSKLTTVIDVIRNDPCIQTSSLRSLLQECVSPDLWINASFIRNFRQRAALFIARDIENGTMITCNDANLLVSNRSISSEELSVTDDPLIRSNLLSILRGVMQNGSTTWHALGFLKKMKSLDTGLSYRLRVDADGLPDAIMWMSPAMKKRLIRYGAILFIDAQKRDYNHFGWPYIGITIKDGTNQIGVCCESIVTTEALDVYEWLLRSMCEIVPEFPLTSIKLIFGDQFLKESLLEKLGISDSVTLRGDYWHLTKQVWPSQNSFGISIMKKIGHYLCGMLRSHTKEQWDLLYHKALREIEGDPSKIDELIKIGNNPEYYAGYYLREIEGNMNCLGDAPAEQNHASICFHLGKGASWSLAEQIVQLFKRQQFDVKKKTELSNTEYIASHMYKSAHGGQMGKDDVDAKSMLTKYAHEKFFLKGMNYSKRISYNIEDNGDFLTWPLDQERTPTNVNLIMNNKRCNCHYRRSYLIQCGHEYLKDGCFKIEKYDTRWLNEHKFDELQNVTITEDNVQFDNDVTHGLDNGRLLSIDNDVGIEKEYIPNAGAVVTESKVTYGDLNKASSDLIRYVVSDSKKSKLVLSTLLQWTQFYKNGEDVGLRFIRDMSVVDSDPNSNNNISNILRKESTSGINTLVSGAKTSDTLNIQRSVAKVSNASGRSVRKKSWLEVNAKKKQKREHALKMVSCGKNNTNNDISIMGQPKVRTYGCCICHKPGHRYKFCPEVIDHGTPLDLKNREARIQLCQRLNCTNQVICNRKENDQRPVNISVPKKVIGVIVHKALWIDKLEDHDVKDVRNICLECTFLKDFGRKVYCYSLFGLACIAGYIPKSMSNIVISKI